MRLAAIGTVLLLSLWALSPALAQNRTFAQTRQMALPAGNIQQLRVHCGAGSLYITNAEWQDTIKVIAEIEIDNVNQSDGQGFAEKPTFVQSVMVIETLQEARHLGCPRAAQQPQRSARASRSQTIQERLQGDQVADPLIDPHHQHPTRTVRAWFRRGPVFVQPLRQPEQQPAIHPVFASHGTGSQTGAGVASGRSTRSDLSPSGTGVCRLVISPSASKTASGLTRRMQS